MNYRIIEHPEGVFTPEKSGDGISWEPVKIEYSHVGFGSWTKHFDSNKKALKCIDEDKEYNRRHSVKRVVYQE